MPPSPHTLMSDDKVFFNDGFGWVCRACSYKTEGRSMGALRSRLLTEGEADGKQPKLSSIALARWADSARTTLICPQCGATAFVRKA